MGEPCGVPKEMENLFAEFLSHIDRMEFSPEKRAGVRCGAVDASTICDGLAKLISASGRRSKRRSEMAAVATQCGTIIMAYYDRVRVRP